MPRWISALVASLAVGALLAGPVTGGAGAAPAKKSPAAQRSHTPSKAHKASKASKAKAQPTKVESTSDDGKPSVSHVCEPGDELGLGEPDTYGGDGAPAPPTRCD